MAYAIEASNLVKTYPRADGRSASSRAGAVQALADLSLAVAPGEVLGLLGPNGAGKSTAIKILTTLAKPDSGTATVAGHDVLRRPDRVRRVIGVVSQRSGADPVANGRDNLLLQGRLYGMRGSSLRRRVSELLDRFDLTGAATRPVRTYSGGMRRRLDVALGLVHQPTVLFLDEPTTGLDPESRAAMWAEIGRLAAADSLAILLTTHYLDEADRLAGRVAIVDRGRVVAEGTPDELKGSLQGDAVHLEFPEPPDESRVRATLGSLAGLVSGLRDVLVDGARLSARAGDGAAAVPVLLAALEEAGLPASTVTVARPSLDDVYLRHAGRRFVSTLEGEAR
jgi:ABC-2 type transport system ATP-binding protein